MQSALIRHTVRVREISPPPGFDPRIVQPTVRRVWCSSEKRDSDTQGMRACVGSTGLNLVEKKQHLSLSISEPGFLIIQLVACSNDSFQNRRPILNFTR